MVGASSLDSPRTLDDLLLYRISHLLSTAGGVVVRLCEGEWGITRREWRVLALLAACDGVLSSQLADRARLDRARTSRAVSSLVAKKLVARQPHPGDGRAAELRLTDTGRELYERVFPRVAALNRELVSVLSESDRAALDRMLAALRTQAETMALRTPVPKANRHLGGRRRAGSAPAVAGRA
ncbi:MAG: MarR family winged helix-turn-helix transcriptional regulator [Burkholderiaceae bacterium]